MIARDINDVYKELLNELYMSGKLVHSRIGNTKEILFKTVYINPFKNIITLDGFTTNQSYAEEELRWYMSGTNRIDFSDKIKRVWKNYSNDGICVASAYGHRIFGGNSHVPKRQWEWCIKELQQNPESRRATLNINLPHDKDHDSKDIPCTMFVQLLVRDGKLIWCTYMRSNDIYYGFRNDVYCFTEMQKRFAKQLGVSVGVYVHSVASLHIYEEQYHKLREAKENKLF